MIYDWFGWCNGYGYPYTDLHTINLDWILCAIKKIIDEIKDLDRRVTDLEGRVTNLEIRVDKIEQDIRDIKTEINNIKEELTNINNEIAHIKIEINNMHADIEKLKGKTVLMIENYDDFQNHTDEYDDNTLCYCKGAYSYNDGGEGFFQIKKESENNWIQFPNIKINVNPTKIGESAVAVRQMTNNLYPLLYFGIDVNHVPTQIQAQNMFEYFALYTKHAELIANKNDNTFSLINLNNVSSITQTNNTIIFKNINFVFNQSDTNSAFEYIAKNIIITECSVNSLKPLFNISQYNLTITNCDLTKMILNIDKSAEVFMYDLNYKNNLIQVNINSRGVNTLSTLRLSNVNPNNLTINNILGYVDAENSTFKYQNNTSSAPTKTLSYIHDCTLTYYEQTTPSAHCDIYNSTVHILAPDNTLYNTTCYNCDIIPDTSIEIKSHLLNCDLILNKVPLPSIDKKNYVISFSSIQTEPVSFFGMEGGKIYLLLDTDRNTKTQIQLDNLAFLSHVLISATRASDASTAKFTTLVSAPEQIALSTIQEDITDQDLSAKGNVKIKLKTNASAV